MPAVVRPKGAAGRNQASKGKVSRHRKEDRRRRRVKAHSRSHLLRDGVPNPKDSAA